MSHENSETIQRKSGAYNVYGGTQYPLTPVYGFEKPKYPNIEEAVNAAKQRSQMGEGPELSSTSAPKYGFQSPRGEQHQESTTNKRPSLFDMLYMTGNPKPRKETQDQIETTNASYPMYAPAGNLRYYYQPTNASGVTSQGRVGVQEPSTRPGTIPGTLSHESLHQRFDVHGSPPDLDEDPMKRQLNGQMERNRLANRMREVQPERVGGKPVEQGGPYWGLQPNRTAEEQIASVYGFEGSLPKGTSLTDNPIGQQLLPDQAAKDYYYENASYPYGGLWNNQGNHTGAGPKFRGEHAGALDRSPVYGFQR